MAGFPHRAQNVSIVNAGLGYARDAQESLYPGLWRNHVGTIAPCMMGGFGEHLEDIAHRGDVWDVKGSAVLRVTSPIGPAFDFDTPVFNGDHIAHIGTLNANSMYKFDVPFTVAFYVNCNQGGTEICNFFVSDRKGGTQNYAGIHVFRGSAESMAIARADGTSETMFGVNGMNTFQTQANFITNDKWTYIVAVVRSWELPDQAKTIGMDFWQNGQMENWDDLGEGGRSQSMIHSNNPNRRSDIGWLKKPARGGTAAEGYQLALWQCWTRALNDWEVRTLSDDPLAMFRRRHRAVGMVPVAATRIVSLGGYYGSTGGRVVLIG